jgi:hypothetical protein
LFCFRVFVPLKHILMVTSERLFKPLLVCLFLQRIFSGLLLTFCDFSLPLYQLFVATDVSNDVNGVNGSRICYEKNIKNIISLVRKFISLSFD